MVISFGFLCIFLSFHFVCQKRWCHICVISLHTFTHLSCALSSPVVIVINFNAKEGQPKGWGGGDCPCHKLWKSRPQRTSLGLLTTWRHMCRAPSLLPLMGASQRGRILSGGCGSTLRFPLTTRRRGHSEVCRDQLLERNLFAELHFPNSIGDPNHAIKRLTTYLPNTDSRSAATDSNVDADTTAPHFLLSPASLVIAETANDGIEDFLPPPSTPLIN